MRVLLFSANTEQEPYPVYPLGMSTVASALVSAGHIVQQEDILVWLESTEGSEQCMKRVIANFSPEAIGISVRNIDNVDLFTSNDHWALEKLRNLVTAFRQYSQSPIILGGAGFSILAEKILEYTQADYGVVGEGEYALCALLDKLHNKQPAERLMRTPFLCSGTHMASPLLDPKLLAHYGRTSGVLNLQTKRGCTKHCLYCTYPMLEGSTIRPRDTRQVITDILTLQKNGSFQEIFFTDAVFNDSQGHWLHLVEAMAQQGINVPWTAFFQPHNLTKEALQLCMRTGLKAVEFGTDATTDTTLRAMRKGFTLESVLASACLCNKLRLPSAHFVIFGGPGETATTLEEGLNNLEKINNALIFTFLGIRIYDDSPLMEYAQQEGTIAPHTSCLHPTYYFSPHVDQEAAADIITKRFRSNRMRIFPPARGQERMQALRQLGFRGILWDSMVRFSPQKTAEQTTPFSAP